MIEMNVHEAKTHLSRLIHSARSGEEVIIANAGQPVAKLVPYHREAQDRIPGLDEGQIEIPDDFDAPLPEDILRLFEG